MKHFLREDKQKFIDTAKFHYILGLLTISLNSKLLQNEHLKNFPPPKRTKIVQNPFQLSILPSPKFLHSI